MSSIAYWKQKHVLPAGNAWTAAGFDNEGAVDFWWTHALISDEVRNSLLHSCSFSGVGQFRESALTATSLDRNRKPEVSWRSVIKLVMPSPQWSVTVIPVVAA